MTERAERTCEECGVEFLMGTGVATTDARGRVERFCSESCAEDYALYIEKENEEDDDLDLDDEDEDDL